MRKSIDIDTGKEFFLYHFYSQVEIIFVKSFLFLRISSENLQIKLGKKEENQIKVTLYDLSTTLALSQMSHVKLEKVFYTSHTIYHRVCNKSQIWHVYLHCCVKWNKRDTKKYSNINCIFFLAIALFWFLCKTEFYCSCVCMFI